MPGILAKVVLYLGNLNKSISFAGLEFRKSFWEGCKDRGVESAFQIMLATYAQIPVWQHGGWHCLSQPCRAEPIHGKGTSVPSEEGPVAARLAAPHRRISASEQIAERGVMTIAPLRSRIKIHLRPPYFPYHGGIELVRVHAYYAFQLPLKLQSKLPSSCPTTPFGHLTTSDHRAAASPSYCRPQ